MTRRVAIYNLYWTTFGGGEQVSGAFAEHLARSFDVTLLGPESMEGVDTVARLGVDVSRCGFRQVLNDDDASAASGDFDVFVNCTYKSHAVSHAARSFYYVHFPEPLATRRDRFRRSVSKAATTVLEPVVPDDRTSKLRRVKRGFQRRIPDYSWVHSYSDYLANSNYTARWVRELWGVPSEIVNPPVRPVVAGVNASDKRPLIASVGRFFDPERGHCKKQLDLLHGFARMNDVGRTTADGSQWRLAFVGGADAPNRDYVLAVRRGALDLPVDVYVNAPRSRVESTLREASIYWHGTGYGEKVSEHPERFEHFGISVVEAMAAGAVPVVYGEAGPAEIVRHGVDGFHWHTLDELADHTNRLMADAGLRASMAESAVRRAADFSLDRFRERVDALLR